MASFASDKAVKEYVQHNPLKKQCDVRIQKAMAMTATTTIKSTRNIKFENLLFHVDLPLRYDFVKDVNEFLANI